MEKLLLIPFVLTNSLVYLILPIFTIYSALNNITLKDKPKYVFLLVVFWPIGHFYYNHTIEQNPKIQRFSKIIFICYFIITILTFVMAAIKIT